MFLGSRFESQCVISFPDIGYFFVSYLLAFKDKFVNFKKKISVRVQSFLHIHARLNYVIEPDWKQTQATAHLKLKKRIQKWLPAILFFRHFCEKISSFFFLSPPFLSGCLHTHSQRKTWEDVQLFCWYQNTVCVCLCVAGLIKFTTKHSVVVWTQNSYSYFGEGKRPIVKEKDSSVCEALLLCIVGDFFLSKSPASFMLLLEGTMYSKY